MILDTHIYAYIWRHVSTTWTGCAIILYVHISKWFLLDFVCFFNIYVYIHTNDSGYIHIRTHIRFCSAACTGVYQSVYTYMYIQCLYIWWQVLSIYFGKYILISIWFCIHTHTCIQLILDIHIYVYIWWQVLPDGQAALTGSWVNAMEGTHGAFACRLEE